MPLLFDIVTHRPIHAYYSMVAFNHLYKLGMQVYSECDNDRLYTLAASNGERHAVLLANLTGSWQRLQINGLDLTAARFYRIDEAGRLAWIPNIKVIENNNVILIEV